MAAMCAVAELQSSTDKRLQGIERVLHEILAHLRMDNAESNVMESLEVKKELDAKGQYMATPERVASKDTESPEHEELGSTGLSAAGVSPGGGCTAALFQLHGQPGANSDDEDEAKQDKAALDKAKLDKAALDKEALAKAALDKAELDKAALDKEALDKAELNKAALDKEALDKAALDKAELDRAALDKLALDKAELDKAARDKEALDKAALNKAALDKEALDKAALDKAELHRAALDKLALDKAALDKAARDKEALDKAALNKAALEKEALDKAALDKAAAPVAKVPAAKDRAAKKPAAKPAAKVPAAKGRAAKAPQAKNSGKSHNSDKEENEFRSELDTEGLELPNLEPTLKAKGSYTRRQLAYVRASRRHVYLMNKLHHPEMDEMVNINSIKGMTDDDFLQSSDED